MPRTSPSRPPQSLPNGFLSARDIDLMYGLEPVFEAGRDGRERPLLESHSVHCPYCWHSYQTDFETALGTQDRIEDCPRCCGPIELQLQVDEFGHQHLEAERAD